MLHAGIRTSPERECRSSTSTHTTLLDLRMSASLGRKDGGSLFPRVAESIPLGGSTQVLSLTNIGMDTIEIGESNPVQTPLVFHPAEKRRPPRRCFFRPQRPTTRIRRGYNLTRGTFHEFLHHASIQDPSEIYLLPRSSSLRSQCRALWALLFFVLAPSLRYLRGSWSAGWGPVDLTGEDDD